MDADDTTLTSAVKYDTDSEHEGTTNNNVRDLGLNCNHASSVTSLLGPHRAPAGSYHIPGGNTMIPTPGNHSRGNLQGTHRLEKP